MVASGASLQRGSRPFPRTHLIGRERERVGARGFLLDDAVPLLTLTGPGGVGKTRLALAIADDVASSFGDGAPWVDLAPLTDPRLVPSAIATALGVALPPGESPHETLIRALQDRQTLVLLDNCEHLLAAVAELLGILLPRCPSLQVLATSRAPLHLHGEQRMPIEPMPLPQAQDNLALVAQNDAVRLFTERARAVRPAFTLTATTTATVADLCRQLNGLPLAIELAAARSAVLSPEALLSLMSERFQLLTHGMRNLPARQQTMTATIAWSYALLDTNTQALFRWLAVFTGGFSLDAVQAIAPRLSASSEAVIMSLELLVEQSLVQRSDGEGDARFSMLETIRAFALERLEASGGANLARDSHAAYFLDFTEHLAPTRLGGNPPAFLDRLALDYDNVRAALEWLSSRADAEQYVRMAGACGWFWYRRGDIREGQRHLDAAMARAGSQPTPANGRVLRWAAELAIRSGDLDTASRFAQASLAVWDALGDPLGRTLAVHVRALVDQQQGHWDTAAALFQEELTFWRETCDPRAIGMALLLLGSTAYGKGDLAAAQVTTMEAADYFRKANDPTWVAAAEDHLGMCAAAERRFAAAARHYRTSLTGYADAGDGSFVHGPLIGLAAMGLEVGQPEVAARLLGAAEAHAQRTGSAPGHFGRQIRDQATTQAQRALGDANVAAAFAEGRASGPDDWFAFANLVVVALESHKPASSEIPGQGSTLLTTRELQVLRLVADGLPDRDVAATLFISQGTVRSHLTSVFSKLAVTSRTGAIASARGLGLL